MFASQYIIKTVISIVIGAVFDTWIKQSHCMILDTHLLVK